MRCKCCDNVLSEWESKARDSIDKSINKEDINIDNP